MGGFSLRPEKFLTEPDPTKQAVRQHGTQSLAMSSSQVVIRSSTQPLHGNSHASRKETSRYCPQMDFKTLSIMRSLPLQPKVAQIYWKTMDCARNYISPINPINLVVDLDLTLLHCTADPRAAILEGAHPLHLSGFNSIYYVVLRPWAREFIHLARQHFTLHVCTLGTREYAQKCMDLLGFLPEEKVRVCAREDLGPAKRKDLAALKVRMDRTLILDDSCNIWRQGSNVLSIARFLVFPITDLSRKLTTEEFEASFNANFVTQYANKCLLFSLEKLLTIKHRMTSQDGSEAVRAILQDCRLAMAAVIGITESQSISAR